jgi:hypothetical protein
MFHLTILLTVEEAICMSGNRVNDYKNLENREKFYVRVFEQWHAKMDDDQTRLNTLEELRNWRREMVETYYF